MGLLSLARKWLRVVKWDSLKHSVLYSGLSYKDAAMVSPYNEYAVVPK